MPDAMTHPTKQELAAFALGKLPERAAAAIAAHLQSCAACRTAVACVSADSFLGKVRAAGQYGSSLPPNVAQPDKAPNSPGQPDKARNSPGQPAIPVVPCPDVPPELVRHPKYLILRELGRGGMGVIYQARHREMDRQVVIKVINRALLERPDSLERFRREIRAAAQLSHPNIVTAYDAEQVGDTHMLVMEFVPGHSLAEVVKKKGPLPVSIACHFARQVALGLQHAYERKMVHRDIKPQNLMLTSDGRVKILDFGLAKVIREGSTSTGLTSHNAYMGTPDYCAPEQSTDARTADIRADLYSLGCTLYCLLAGRPPFREDTIVKTILAHMQREPQPLPELRADVAMELWQVVTRLLAKEPAQRYEKPIDVTQALTPFIKWGPKKEAKGGSELPQGMASPGKGTAFELETSQGKQTPQETHVKEPPKEVAAKEETASPSTPVTGEARVRNGVVTSLTRANPSRLQWWKRPGVLAGGVGVFFALIFTSAIINKIKRQMPNSNSGKAISPMSGTGELRKVAVAPPKGPTQASGKEAKPPMKPKLMPSTDDKLGRAPLPARDLANKTKEDREVATPVMPQRLPDAPGGSGEAKSNLTKANAEDARTPDAEDKPAKDYQLSCEAARAKLLKGFDAAMDELARMNGAVDKRMKWIEIVKKEKERFEESHLIPWSEPMRPHVDLYLLSLTAALKNLLSSYESLIDRELRARNHKMVDRLLAGRKKRLEIKVMAKWRHIVDGRGPGVIFTLYSNGKIDEGDAFWTYAKGILELTRPVPGVPGCFSVDRLFISSDGATYEGTSITTPQRRPHLTGVYVLDALGHPIAVGTPAPEIEGEDIDGKKFKLSDYRGKVVLLDFWGNWQPPCRSMYSHERSLIKRLEGKPFILIGVNSDSDRAELKKVMDKEKITWRSFWNGGSTNGRISSRWGIKSWPTLFLIDAQGVVRHKHVSPASEKNINEEVDKLIAEVEKTVAK